MPPCHMRTVKLVAEADVPILPFLAPRVFQPWPSNARPPSRYYNSVVSSCTAPTKEQNAQDKEQGPGRRRRQQQPVSVTGPSSRQFRCYAAQSDPVSRPNALDRTRPHTVPDMSIQDSHKVAFASLDAQLLEQLGHERVPNKHHVTDTSLPSAHRSRTSRSKGPATRGLEGPNARESGHSPNLAAAVARGERKGQAQKHYLRSRATIKGRHSASRMSRLFPTRTKWIRVGHPVKLPSQWVDPEPLPDSRAQGQDQAPPVSHARPEHDLGYTIPERVYTWNYALARLRILHDHSPHPSRDPTRKRKLDLDPKASQYASEILHGAPTPSSITSPTSSLTSASSSLPLDIAQLEQRFNLPWLDIWLNATLHLLQTEPILVPHFLSVTHLQPYPPAAWIDDCLHFLSTHFSKPDVPVPDALFDQFIHVFCALMHRPASTPLLSSSSTIRRLLVRCDQRQTLAIFDSVVRHRVKVHWNTLLHLATSLAHQNHFDQALDALLESATSGADILSPQFESTCSTILRKAVTQSDGLRVSLRIVQNLSELGVNLNIQHCNIAILNAVESGDLQSAFSVYNSLVDNGLRADKYTHAILLKGCKSAIEDSDTLNATIRQAIRDTDVLKSPIVATEILHCLYLHHFQRSPETAFSIVAEAYTQLFDATSLIRMQMLPVDSQDPSQGQRVRPTLAALGIMVVAYLRNGTHRHNSHSARQQYNLYRHIRTLVGRRVQPWLKLVETDYLANAFLMAFTLHPSSLAYAAEIIRDMQTPLPAEPDSPNPLLHTSKAVCKPTVQSWSIFLHGFARHRKMDLAEQVLQYMREKGMKPNQVTWNSLLGGYVGIRDHDGAVQAFKKMQDEGFRGNDVTLRAMTRIRVDAGMLSQGEEVREALTARVANETPASSSSSASSLPLGEADESMVTNDESEGEHVADADNHDGAFWDADQEAMDDYELSQMQQLESASRSD